MSNCAHARLHVDAKVFNLTTGDATVNAVHVTVACRDCAMPFRFVGQHRPPPEDPGDFMLARGPWAAPDGAELCSWIVPMESDDLLLMPAQGAA